MSANPGASDDPRSQELRARTAACDAVKHVLRDRSEVLRFYAVRALGGLARGEDTSDLLDCLRDPDEDVRMETVVALGRLGNKEAVPHLTESLTHDPCAEVKVLAIEALDKLDASSVIPMLRDIVGNQNLDVPWSDNAAEMLHDGFDLQAKAASVLGRIGDETAADAILGMLDEDGTESFGAVATRAFVGMGDTGISALRQCLERKVPRLRRQAAGALAGMEHDDAPAMLNSLLRDTDAGVRQVALAALARRAPQEPALLELFVDADPGVRAEVARLTGPRHPEALLDRLKDKNAAVRQAAVIACAELTGDWRAAAARLLVSMFDGGFDDDDAQGRAQLVETLGQIAPGLLEACLPRWLDAENAGPAARSAMAKNLARLGGVDSVTLLSRLVDDAAHAVRAQALAALASIAASGGQAPSEQAESALVSVLRCKTGQEIPISLESPSTDATLPEMGDQNPESDAADTDQEDTFPSSTLAAIMGRNDLPSLARPPEQPIEHTPAELAHLEHAFKRRARRHVSVEPQVPPPIDARRIAARIAGNLKSPAVLQTLVDALAEDDLELKRGAADSISRMLERGTDASCVSPEALSATFSARDRQLSVSLLKILPYMPAEPARDMLTEQLEENDAAIRAGCIQSLQMMGEEIPQIERWLSDEASGVRCTAATALAQRDGRAAVPTLVAQCFRGGGEDRAKIAMILRDLDITAASDAMLTVLSDSQRRGDWQVAIEVIAVLHGTS